MGAPQRERAVTKKELRDAEDGEIGGIFPAAVREGEHPAIAPMRPGGSEGNRQKGERGPTRLHAENEQDAAHRLDHQHNVGEPARSPRPSKKLTVPGRVKMKTLRNALWAMKTMPSEMRSSAMPYS